MLPELIDGDNRRPICADCGDPFARSAADRRDPAMPPPARCPACRDRRRERRNAAHLDAIRRGLDGRPRPAPGPDVGHGPLTAAACTACGLAIRLPFNPDPSRPVYCRSCLAALRGR